jgi:DNA-binding transcriptional LysR family regulator
MVDGALSIADMQFLVAMRDIYVAHGERPLNYDQLKNELLERNMSVGNGVGREVDDLEIKLGGPKARGNLLLQRKKSGSLITAMGVTIARQCETVLDQIKELARQIDVGRQTLRFGVTNAVTTNMLPSVFKDPGFFKLVPNTDFEIVEGEAHELVTTLLTSVEFAIGSKDLIPNDCRAESLCKRKRVLLYNPTAKYQHDYSRPGTIFSLKEWIRDEILLVPATRVVPELEDFLRPMKNGHKIVLPTASSRRAWVERGVGIAISHEEKSADLNHNASIRTIDLSAELGETELMIYFRKRHQLSPAAECLVRIIRQLFGERRDPGMAMSQ